MDFIYFFRALYKRKWTILLAGILAAGTAYYFTRDEPKVYRSTSQITTGFTISDVITVGDAPNIWDAENKFNNVIVTWTSPIVTSLISYKLILHDLTSNQPFRRLTEDQKRSTLYKQVNQQDAIRVFTDKLETMNVLSSFDSTEKKLLEYLDLYNYGYKSVTQSLSVYRLQRTDYLQLDYFSENPLLSAFAVNTAYQQFLRYYKSVRSNRSQESLDTLRSLMEKKREEYEDRNRVAKSGGLSAASPEANNDAIAALEQQLTMEKTSREKLFSEIRKVNQRIASAGNTTSSPTVNNNAGTNDELLILREQKDKAYKDWLNGGRTDNALLEKYNGLLAQYQKKLTESSTTPRRNEATSNFNIDDLLTKKDELDIDIEAANKSIADIQSRINMLKGSISKDISIGNMVNDVDLASQEYTEAKKKYSDAIDMNSSAVNNFRQVLYGQPAIAPEPSKRKLIIGMAGIATILLTMLVIIFITYLDSSVKTPRIFAKTVNLKLISMINFMDLKHKSIGEIIAKQDVIEDSKEKSRQNVFRESLRKLRHAIEKSGNKIFLFTSTKKGEGKTTLIQALSYSMSLSKKKILIIDTNFCNNDLTVQLNANPILENIQLDESSSKSIVDQIVSSSKNIDGGSVFAIGSEGGDYTPSEILPRHNILHHLKDLTEKFDFIFLEGPPLNDFSDARELVDYVDGVIAVFSANRNIKQLDKDSIGFYHELNGKFTGAVLNKVDIEDVNIS